MDLPADGLLPGERLLWWGQPQRLTLTLLDWGQFAVGLLWGIATVVIPLARHDPLSFFSWVVGLGGLASFWGAVAARVRARRSVAYLLTDRRIVLADRLSGRTRVSAYLGTLPPPVVRIRQDGSGTIVFRSSSRFGPVPARSSVSLLMTGLVAVPEAGRVRDLIVAAQAGA